LNEWKEKNGLKRNLFHIGAYDSQDSCKTKGFRKGIKKVKILFLLISDLKRNLTSYAGE